MDIPAMLSAYQGFQEKQAQIEKTRAEAIKAKAEAGWAEANAFWTVDNKMQKSYGLHTDYLLKAGPWLGEEKDRHGFRKFRVGELRAYSQEMAQQAKQEQLARILLTRTNARNQEYGSGWAQILSRMANQAGIMDEIINSIIQIRKRK